MHRYIIKHYEISFRSIKVLTLVLTILSRKYRTKLETQ